MCTLSVTHVTSTSTSTYTAVSYFGEAQADANWSNLSPEQRAYFNHLAENDPERTGQAFYEETVPVELQDKPELVESYLNGDPELGVSDKDWSHDVSRDNGGSDSADNGRFEDLSKNRSRGSDNTTPEEQYAADEASEEDVQTLLESAEEVGNATLAASAVEFAGSALEFGLDCFAPVVGGGWAAVKTAEQFTSTKDKLGYGSLAGGAAVAYLVSPAGPPTVALYVGYKGVKKLYSLWSRRSK